MLIYYSEKVFARRRNTFQCVTQACLLPVGCPESGPAAQLCEKAAHHSASVSKVDGHLDRQGDDPDSTERYTVDGGVIAPCGCPILTQAGGV